jgi:hypothetical protein
MTRSILEYSRVAGNVLTSKSKREENRQKRQVEKFYVAAKEERLDMVSNFDGVPLGQGREARFNGQPDRFQNRTLEMADFYHR